MSGSFVWRGQAQRDLPLPFEYQMKDNPIREKSYAFALAIVRFTRELSQKREHVLSKQLLRAGTSIGANVEEGVVGQSRRDFISKMSIARKEAFECNYWLRLVRDAGLTSPRRVQPLIDESDALGKMLTAIVKSAQEK